MARIYHRWCRWVRFPYFVFLLSLLFWCHCCWRFDLGAGCPEVLVLGAGCPEVFVFPGVSSPKGSWGVINDAARAIGCRTAMKKRRWAIRQSPPTIWYDRWRPRMHQGLYTLLPARSKRADVSDVYRRAPCTVKGTSLLVILFYFLVDWRLSGHRCLSAIRYLYVHGTRRDLPKLSRGSTLCGFVALVVGMKV